MKTALKDLIEKLQKFRLIKEDENSYELFRQLEYEAELKEKEQIIDACNANLKGFLTNGKNYYDLNFNHHIESEPNTYTNFTPYDANAKAEYNDSLTNFTPNI